ncbi:MAG TPA: hypothetical protein VJ696_05535 [Rhodanobacteraceae bacterium]|nr:hypothetical protein [Rhodanobacteraceae bacterium]
MLVARALSLLTTMVIPMAANPASPSAAPVTDAARREAILAAARAPAEKELATPVRLGVRSVNAAGDWAFVLADLEGSDGRPFDYAKTPKAEAAQQGLLSRRYAALLKLENGKWTVVDERVGPTDPAWLGWSAKHGAPEDLFATD